MPIVLQPIDGGPEGGLVQTITVRDAVSQSPIAGAVIRYAQAGSTIDTATTNPAGVALIAVLAGTYQRTVMAVGFDSSIDAQIAVSSDNALTVVLSRVSQSGNPIRVTPGFAN